MKEISLIADDPTYAECIKQLEQVLPLVFLCGILLQNMAVRKQYWAYGKNMPEVNII